MARYRIDIEEGTLANDNFREMEKSDEYERNHHHG